MRTRPLRLPDDVSSLRRLAATSHSDTVFEVATTPRGFTLTEVPVVPPVLKPQDVVGEVTRPDRRWTEAWVAVQDEQLVGMASTEYHRWNRRQQLWGLYVDAGHRGCGVGRALVNIAMDHGRRNGARQLWLETQNTNVPAVRAYRAMGFDLVGLDRTLYDGAVAHETALYFARPL